MRNQYTLLRNDIQVVRGKFFNAKGRSRDRRVAGRENRHHGLAFSRHLFCLSRDDGSLVHMVCFVLTLINQNQADHQQHLYSVGNTEVVYTEYGRRRESTIAQSLYLRPMRCSIDTGNLRNLSNTRKLLRAKSKAHQGERTLHLQKEKGKIYCCP